MLTLLSLAASSLVMAGAGPAAPDTRVFELRTYYAAEGKLDSLHARFRDHTTKLFARHGITNIGYWTPVDNPERKLIYIVAFPDRAARDRAFGEFGADPEWQKTVKESEANGTLVDRITSQFLTLAPYSPAPKATRPRSPRLFELRIYKTRPGRFGALNARFRDHTLGLFAKHGIANVAYWSPLAGDPGADDTLVYIVAHRDPAGAAKGWDGFRKDPKWLKARDASEAAGAILAEPPSAVYMQPTDYSPIR